MKKVIVTGCSGFIGGVLTETLLKQEVIVYGVGRNEEKMKRFSSPYFIPVICDFEEYSKLPALIKDQDIDVFYHFAWDGGFTSAIKDYKLQMKNAVSVGDAVMAASAISAKRFVYANTYNQNEILNFLSSETFEPRYTCIYSTGKTAGSLIARTLCWNLGMEYCGGQIPMPYGEGNYSRQLANIVIDCLNKKQSPKLIEGNNLYDLVYIQDIADAFVAIGEKGINMKEYYIGHRELKTFRKWMEEIRDILAPEVELKFGEYKDNQQIDYSRIDLDALYRDTGFECVSDFRRTILNTSAWVRTLNW